MPTPSRTRSNPRVARPRSCTLSLLSCILCTFSTASPNCNEMKLKIKRCYHTRPAPNPDRDVYLLKKKKESLKRTQAGRWFAMIHFKAVTLAHRTSPFGARRKHIWMKGVGQSNRHTPLFKVKCLCHYVNVFRWTTTSWFGMMSLVQLTWSQGSLAPPADLGGTAGIVTSAQLHFSSQKTTPVFYLQPWQDLTIFKFQ